MHMCTCKKPIRNQFKLIHGGEVNILHEKFTWENQVEFSLNKSARGQNQVSYSECM